jgi:cyclophilin family peptidyl-prolyl cis-trans isomerase
MASEQPAVDFSGLEDVFEAIKVRKNFIIGLVLIVLLIVAGWKFIAQQMSEREMKPWHAIFATSTPWFAPPEELASLAASPEVKGTPAEPFALYWEALRRFENKDTAGAIEKLGALQKNPEFSKSPLCSLELTDPEKPSVSTSVVARMIQEMQRLEQWGKTYPVPTANPPPTSPHAVSIATSRGTIVIALYEDVAPLSCAAFLKTAPLLKDRFIGRASADAWLELGQKEDGANVEAPDAQPPFPPYEQNKLSHFQGTVSYRQAPFSKAPFFADLRIDLKTDFNEDGRSTVFGQVMQGIDVLMAISKDEHETDAPTKLKSPVKIDDVTVQTAEGH